MKKKTEFQVTVSYFAIVTFIVKAEDKEEAEQIVMNKINDKGIYDGETQHEQYSVAGTLDMDKTWNKT